MNYDQILSWTAQGHIRTNHGGQIVVDSCLSDNEHLVSGLTDPETNKPVCRRVLEHAFDELVGKKGTLVVSVIFVEEPKNDPA